MKETEMPNSFRVKSVITHTCTIIMMTVADLEHLLCAQHWAKYFSCIFHIIVKITLLVLSHLNYVTTRLTDAETEIQRDSSNLPLGTAVKWQSKISARDR